MDDELQPEDVTSLLRSIELDSTRTSPNRARIRQDVLKVFDAAPDLPHLVDPNRPGPVVIDGVQRPSISKGRLVGWMAAAAAVVIAVIVAQSAFRALDTTPTASDGSGERRLSVMGDGSDALLEPGPQVTDVIADGLSFDAPAGLTVVEEREGQLVLAASGEPEGTGQLVIVEIESSDWERELTDLAEADELALQKSTAIVGGSATTRWDATITGEALTERSCTIPQPCIRLASWPPTGPAAIWAGSDNRIVQIGQTSESLVLAIEVSQRFQGPLSRLADQLLNTATLKAR